MREWINKRFGTELNEDDLTSVKDFALIWNIFESHTCSSNFSIRNIEVRLQNHQFEMVDLQPFLDYFRDRYISGGIFNGRFPHLNFRPNDRQLLVEEVLLGNNTNPNEIILALLIIVYRFRNNLFHGIKDIQVIEEQKRNFENANEFLKLLLERI